jgi:ATP-binding cassette subfamily C protein CydCD
VKPLDPRLLQYSRSSRGFILLEVFFAITNAGLVIGQSFALASLVVQIFTNHANRSMVSTRLSWILIIFLARGVINYFTEYVAAKSSIRMRNELRTGLLDKLLSGRSRAVFRQGPASVSLVATKGIDSLDSYFSRFLPQLVIAAVIPLIVGVTIAFADLISGFVVLGTVPLIPLFGIMIGRFTGAATQKRWRTLAVLGGYFLDLLSGLPTLKVFERSKKQVEKLRQVGDQYQEETMKVLRISFLSSLALEIIATLSVALIAVSIGLRLVNGSLSLRTGLFVLILSPEVYWPIRQVALYFHAASDGIEAANQIFKILEEPEQNRAIKIDSVDSIQWSALSINYSGREEIQIPSSKICLGQVNAIVGPSGVGKSSFIAILLGFLTDYQGEINVSSNGKSYLLSELDLDHWRSVISWLPQEVNFPAGSVREVLSHATPTATDELLIQTLLRVGLSLQDLPLALDTQLGTLTETLSVGQKRKIGLARALLKPCQLLVLDEPSASVDDVSEADIANAIAAEVVNGKIVLLVSHREGLVADIAPICFGALPR